MTHLPPFLVLGIVLALLLLGVWRVTSTPRYRRMRTPMFVALGGVLLLLALLITPASGHRADEEPVQCPPPLLAGHALVGDVQEWDSDAVQARQAQTHAVCSDARTRRLSLALLVSVPTSAALAVALVRRPLPVTVRRD